MWQSTTAEVLKNLRIAKDRYLLRARDPSIAQAEPGQFVHCLVRPSLDPFLRRPFSVAMVEGDEFCLLYAVKGTGTQVLSRVRPGEVIGVMGPLGRPFPLTDGDALLIAGGMGVAPLIFLARHLAEKGARVRTIVGARNERELVGLDLLMPWSHVLPVTEDGSRGCRGTAIDLMKKELEKGTPTVYACGPGAMLEQVRLHTEGLKCHVSLEARMGCAVGACLGCAIPGKEGYLRVCKDGPVFNLEEVGCLE